jgi:hypothetical protein
MSACAAAAGVLLGMWIGIQSQGTHSTPTIVESSAPGDGSEDSTLTSDDSVPPPAFETIRLTVNTPDGPQIVEMPVISSADLPNLSSMASSISPEVREQFERQGIELAETPGVIRLPIDDARSLAVPVQTVQMRRVAL